MTAYDAIVIGTGQAGPYVTSRLAGAGMKVAVIERSAFGGTCVNTGCIPTKTMVASAYAARVAASRRRVWRGRRLSARRHEARHGAERRGVRSSRAPVSKTGCGTWSTAPSTSGHARFESAHEVNVGGERLRADKVFINVGGRALVPDMPGLREIDYLTNSSMMSVDFLPEAPDRRRRQLHRSRIRSDVSALRRRGHDHRDGAAPRRPRGRRRLDRDPGDRRARGCRGARELEVHQLRQAWRRDRRQRRLCRRCAASARHARAARCRPPSQYRRSGPREGRASRSTSGATSWSTTSSARSSRESGRSAIATARARSRTRRTTTPRS